jgi:benzoylformate decarboxylase
LDDWDQPALGEALVRSVSVRCSPDPERIALFAERIKKSKNPVLVYGPEIERAGGWDAGIKFAEQLRASVYISPLADRASFPQTHPQFRGMVPIAIGPLSKKLQGHDLIIVIGAQVFRYYPFIAGDYLPPGAELIQVTNDPWDAAAAVAGESLLSDAKLALEAFIDAIPAATSRTAPAGLPIERNLPSPPNNPLTALEAFAALSELRPKEAILVNETASNFGDLMQYWPIQKSDTYYTFASGGLGWGSPAAVGVALAEKKMGTSHPVIAVIGDGAFQYSVQDVYTAVQLKLKVVFVVPCNGEYAILKEFAVLEKTPNVPGLELPGLDVISAAKGFGCATVHAKTTQEIKQAFAAALKAEGPTLIAIPIARQERPLVAPVD